MSTPSPVPIDLHLSHDDAFAKLGGYQDAPVPTATASSAIARLAMLAQPFGLGLPSVEVAENFTARMVQLADIDRDGFLSEREFQLMWKMLPISSERSLALQETKLKMSSDARSFVFGSREDWIGGMQRKLRGCVSRSVRMECTLNSGGKYRSAFEYITQQPAAECRRGVDAFGEPILFDEGHDGMMLDDFVALAAERGAQLTRVEVGVLRMYTYVSHPGQSAPGMSSMRSPSCPRSGCPRSGCPRSYCGDLCCGGTQVGLFPAVEQRAPRPRRGLQPGRRRGSASVGELPRRALLRCREALLRAGARCQWR